MSMDVAAYLTNQGWRGDGHALHCSGRGITKPVHASQKANVLGVGKKQHDAYADQWWARAFDDTLKGLNVSNNEVTRNTEGILVGSGAQALQVMGTRGAKSLGQGGLYSNFVRGESLSGTLIREEKDHSKEQLYSEDNTRLKGASMEIPATVANGGKRRKKKRGQQREATAKHPKLDPKNVGMKIEYERRGPQDTRKNDQGRQKKRRKGADKTLEAVDSGSKKASDNCNISTLPNKRSKG